MKPVLGVLCSSFRENLFSPRSAVLLLLIATVVVAGCTEMLTRQAMQMNTLAAQMIDGEGSAFPVYPLIPGGTAHAQVWDAINYRFFRSSNALGGPLLPMRYAAVWMAFFLPVLSLLLTFDSVSADLESGLLRTLRSLPASPRSILLARLGGRTISATVSLLVGLSVGLIIVGKLTPFSWTSEQLVRLSLFLAFALAYTMIFALIGVLVSALARYSTRAMWICAIIAVAVFATHILVENTASLVPWDLPRKPEMSVDVREHLLRAQILGVSQIGRSDEGIAAYLQSLREHSEAVYQAVHRRYQHERWLNLISPSHWMAEVSNQVLQDEFVVITDAFRGMPYGYYDGSLMPMLNFMLPEVAWAVALLVGLVIAVSRALFRLEV